MNKRSWVQEDVGSKGRGFSSHHLTTLEKFVCRHVSPAPSSNTGQREVMLLAGVITTGLEKSNAQSLITA